MRCQCQLIGICFTSRCSLSPSCRIDIFKYVIYGVAAAFFVYGILLMVEGFFTTGAIRDLYGDFKITTCGRCVSAWVRKLVSEIPEQQTLKVLVHRGFLRYKMDFP